MPRVDPLPSLKHGKKMLYGTHGHRVSIQHKHWDRDTERKIRLRSRKRKRRNDKPGRRGEIMPGSVVEGKVEAVEMLRRHGIECKRVLDVGTGHGTWIKLLRNEWPEAEWVGIEIFRPYIDRYDLNHLYDVMYCGNALTIPLKARLNGPLKKPFDLAIFGDVVEHLDKREGIEMVMRHKWEHALISVPIVESIQGEYDGNIYETHLYQWDEPQMIESFPVIDWWCGSILGVFLLRRPS